MLRCIPACAINGSRRKCSRSAAWNSAVWSLAHPLAHGGCAKTGMHLLKQEHVLLHIQAITGNAHPRVQDLRRLGWKVTGKLAPFASLAHDTSFAFFLSPQICSVYLFCCNCHWNFCPGYCLSGASPHPLLLFSISPHLSSHHADSHPNWSWTSPGIVRN